MQMNKRNKRRQDWKIIAQISPEDVMKKNDDEILIVNRSQINAKLAFYTYDAKNSRAKSNIKIMKQAINEMMRWDRKEKTMNVGAEMTVKQIKQIFTDMDDMPSNSFYEMQTQK